MEHLQDAHKFKLWKKNLVRNGLTINNIEEVHTRRYKNGEVLFSLVLLDATTPEGNKIPPICFIKGEVVMVLVCLIDTETHQKNLLLVKQRRIADGNINFEHPAGMVDNTKTPLEIAVQEVREETGIFLTEKDLKPLLNHQRMFPSTGTSDECMYFFYTEISMTKTETEALNHKNMGLLSEHEFITTEVLPFEEAHKKINNTNCILLNLAYLLEVEDFDLLKKLKQ